MPGKRILLVEDEVAVHQLFAYVLHAEGYEVDVVMTVADAMEYLDARPYALAIVDWRLPDGDGMVIADAAAKSGAKTLVMSAYLFQMSVGLAYHHETLMKPLRANEMIAAVERSIGKAGVG